MVLLSLTLALVYHTRLDTQLPDSKALPSSEKQELLPIIENHMLKGEPTVEFAPRLNFRGYQDGDFFRFRPALLIHGHLDPRFVSRTLGSNMVLQRAPQQVRRRAGLHVTWSVETRRRDNSLAWCPCAAWNVSDQGQLNLRCVDTCRRSSGARPSRARWCAQLLKTRCSQRPRTPAACGGRSFPRRRRPPRRTASWWWRPVHKSTRGTTSLT